jgi:hypothetical protein
MTQLQVEPQTQSSFSPLPADEAEQMWERFIRYLNAMEPLLAKYKVVQGKRVMVSSEPHKTFLGSIESYKKMFMEANGGVKSRLPT